MNEEVKTVFKFNSYVLNKTLDGISHEDSLKTDSCGANNINWVIGHIVVTRDVLLEALGLEPLCNDELTKLYVRGSDAITPGKAENFSKLIGMYNKSQEQIMKVLNEKDCRENSETNETVSGLGFHEAYHVGQLGILRRFLGMPGVIK